MLRVYAAKIKGDDLARTAAGMLAPIGQEPSHSDAHGGQP